jgi:tight adherence protein B
VFGVMGVVLVASAEWLERASRRTEAASSALLDDEASPLLKKEVLSTISVWAYLLSKFAFVDRLKRVLAEADLGWSVGRLTLMMLLLAGLVSGLLINMTLIPAWSALMAAVAAMLLPYFHVCRVRQKRLTAIEQQLPDAMDFLARSLRAGHPFSTATRRCLRWGASSGRRRKSAGSVCPGRPPLRTSANASPCRR